MSFSLHNLEEGLFIHNYWRGTNIVCFFAGLIAVSVLIISLLNPLFKLGARLLNNMS